MRLPSGELEARVPRQLLSMPRGCRPPSADVEGLSAIRLRWRDGRLLTPEPLQSTAVDLGLLPLVLPRLVDPHVHLDKAFSWTTHPNPDGTYDGAMAANLQEHQTRSASAVLARGEKAIRLACANGLRSLRTHIDSVGPGAQASWDALQELQQRWRDRVHLQLVALVPIDHWSTPEGVLLGRRVAAAGGLLGGVLVPPCRGAATRRALRSMLNLAEQLGCGVDVHIDESATDPAQGLHQLLTVLDAGPVSVPVCCSHASSLGLMRCSALRRLADRMAAQRLRVIALPLTNGWLLGRRAGVTPVLRPLAPVHQLQHAGVTVAVGGDNIADPWFPAGDLDPVALMAACLPLAQLAPWQRLGLSPFTTAAAQVMDLPWDGLIGADAPADLIVLQANSWSEALRRPPSRRILVAGRWWAEETR